MLTVNLKKVNINLEESKGEVAQECAASIASCDDLVYNYSTFILLYLMRSVVRKQWRPRTKVKKNTKRD